MKLFYVLFLFSFLAQSHEELSKGQTTLTKDTFIRLIEKEPYSLVYTVSEAMPLSSKGLKDIKSFSKKKKIRLIILNDPLRPLPHSKYPLIERSDYFLRRGFFHHFPSISLYKRSSLCGSLVPGLKEAESLDSLFSLLQSQCSSSVAYAHSRSLSAKAKAASITELRKIKIPRKIGYYSRPVNNSWQSYYTGAGTYLFDTENLAEFPFQGSYDLIASPDARFLTLPNNLRFFSAAAVFENLSGAAALKPFYTDIQMIDQYQSIGILKENTYRVITAWTTDVVFKDYLFNEQENSLTPIADKALLCPNLKASTPILSKDGTMIGAYRYGPQDSHTTHILKVNPEDKTCESILDLGTRTGKLDFSFDNKFVAYIATDERQKLNLGAYVTRIADGETWEFAAMQEKEAISFPSFKPNGNVLLLRSIKVENKEDNFFEEYTLDLNVDE